MAPLAWFSREGNQDRKSIRTQGPTAIGELSQDEKPGPWVQIPHPDRVSCSRYPVSSFLRSTGFHVDFITELGTPAGETWGFRCAPPPALPWLGKNVVTVFSNVPVFKVISFLKCNFLAFFSDWVTFLKVGGSRSWGGVALRWVRRAWWSRGGGITTSCHTATLFLYLK